MKPHTIYQWSGDYFCDGCIVSAILSVPPFEAWTEDEDNDTTAQSTEGTLDLIAGEFDIGHSKREREAANFPVRLKHSSPPQGTHFCRTCLTLLTMEADHDT